MNFEHPSPCASFIFGSSNEILRFAQDLLPLALLVFGILADHANNTAPTDDLTIVAYFFD